EPADPGHQAPELAEPRGPWRVIGRRSRRARAVSHESQEPQKPARILPERQALDLELLKGPVAKLSEELAQTRDLRHEPRALELQERIVVRGLLQGYLARQRRPESRHLAKLRPE